MIENDDMVTEDQMNKALFCDVCNSLTGSLGVCYGCAMAMNEVRELVDSLRMVYNGGWEVTLNGEDYFIENLIVFRPDGVRRADKCLQRCKDPQALVDFFTDLAQKGSND